MPHSVTHRRTMGDAAMKAIARDELEREGVSIRPGNQGLGRNSPSAGGDRQAGAALIVATLAVLLLALAILGGMRFWGPKDDLRRASANNANARVVAAIDRYVAANGALPCPETDGTGNAAAACGTATTWGLVPWRTLGIGPQDAADAWSRRLTYVVPVNSNGSTPYVCNTSAAANAGGGLATSSGLLPYGGTVSTSLAYVLINHGPNGRGAFQQSGGVLGPQLAALQGSTEAYNCPKDVTGATCYSPATNTYYPGPYQPQTAGDTVWFDDIVTAQISMPYGPYCKQPILTTTLDRTSGLVLAKASITSPASGTIVWTTNIGQGSNWSSKASTCPGYDNGIIPNMPTPTWAGRECSVSAITSESTTISASNIAPVGWPSAAQPAFPTFSITILSSTISTIDAANIPTITDMGITATGNEDPSIAIISGDTTTSKTFITYKLILTIDAGGSTLCYDSKTMSLGIIQSDGTSCYIGNGDILNITFNSSSYKYYDLLFYAFSAGQTTITPDDDDPDSLTFTTGYLATNWRQTTKTASDGTTTHPAFSKLTISPSSPTQIGLVEILAGN